MEGDWRMKKPCLLETMSHLLDTGLYSDLTFEVGPTKHKVNAHRMIIMGRSEVFAITLQDRWDNQNKDGTGSTITIPDTSPRNFNLFIRYLYTDEFSTEITMEDALELLSLAHMYQVPGLITKCSEFLKRQINKHNCVHIYHSTILYQDQQVEVISQAAFDFLTNNIGIIATADQFLHLNEHDLTKLLQSDDLVVNEAVLFNAVLRWSEEEVETLVEDGVKKTRKETFIQSLVPLIRFPLMTPEAFAKYVVPTNVLGVEESLQLFLYFNSGAQVRFSTKPRARRNIPQNFQNLVSVERFTEPFCIRRPLAND